MSKAQPYYPDATNGSTGVSGVYRQQKLSRGRRHPYYCSTVRYSKENVKTISRSIEKHGEVPAFIQAVNFRQKGLEEVYGDRFNYSKFIRPVEKYLRKIVKEEAKKEKD